MAANSLDPSLLASAKKPKPKAKGPADGGGAPVVVDPRAKRILKIAAYIAIFCSSLVFFTILKIPDSVVANVALNALNTQTPYRWQAEKIGLAFFLTPHIYFEKLNLEPQAPDGLAFALTELRIYPNPFSLLPIGGPPALGGSFKADAYSARFTGSFTAGASISLKLETENTDLAKLTPLSEAGLNIKGIAKSLYLKLTMPNQRLSGSDGQVQLSGKNLVFDPGPLALPMALPILNLGDVEIRGTISHGQLKIEKFQVGGAKGDLEVQASGTITLSDMLALTRLDIHLRVKPCSAM
jgi:type II secretion system protein N